MTRGDDSSGQTALSGSAARKARLGSREALSEARELLARELDEVRERERATRSELEAEVDDLRVQVSQLTRRLQETLQGLAESQSEQAILAQDLSERQELVLELERAQEKLGQALQQEQDRSEELLSALEHARLDGEEALRTGQGHVRAAQDYRAAEARLRAKLEQFESEVKALKQKSRNAPEARDSDASTFHAEVSPGSALDATSHEHRQSRRHGRINNSLAPNSEAPRQQEAFERCDEVKDSDTTDPEASPNFEIDASLEPNLGRHGTQKSKSGPAEMQ
ncbi:Hypothetical Protein FCC1311_102712 [Hondaea fermentalgiana]|uniref:Uncharacterized protein n=1 Tax=Hondaea fermentalgiana TaxID=2315210 RepID=A0A2R5GWA4_9STRA|nr:Hypothetical Protein FCC1311_102712 [Hondaea fermentalgiana]|eukprot:GBG34048.1 Hypothetical Protein FCC1311_102712 [Hondaea fermentalgiana]